MKPLDSLMESPLVARAVEAYNSLAPRDQTAVKILGGFLGPVVLVFGLLLPLTDYFYSGVDRYRDALSDHRWMEANRGRVAATSRSDDREPGQSLFGVANATAKGFQVNFKRYEPVDNNALSLWIENVDFNNLVLWLERLDKRHGVSVREIAVERQPAEGRVNARLVLQG